MGIYAEAVQKLYVAYFNRPADALGLIYWEEQITKNGGSAAAVANAFSASQEYKDLYAGKDSANVVNAIYMNLFGRAAETDGLLYWGSRLENKTFDIGTIAMAILNGAQNDDKKVIDNKTAAAVEFTKALDTTAEIVAYSGNAANAVAKAWLATVTATADSLTAAKAAVGSTITSIGSGTVANGQTFTLTNGADTFTGAEKNDVFNAGATILAADGTTVINSLQNVDVLTGGAGTDKLNVTLATATTVAATLTGIEDIAVRATAAGTLDLVSATGVQSITVANSTAASVIDNVGAVADLRVAGISAAAASVSFDDSTATTLGLGIETVGKVATTGAVEVAIDLGAATASKATTLNIAVNNSNVEVKDTAGTNVATTATIAASGVSEVKLTDGLALTSLTVTGAGSVDVSEVGLVKVATLTAGDGGVKFSTGDSTATTFTATTGAGKDTLTVDGAVVKSISTGAGNDAVTTSTAGLVATASIDLGAGDDTLTLHAAPAGEGATLTGGEGTDTLALAAADYTTVSGYATANLAKITGFDTLKITDALANGTTTDVSKVTGISNFVAGNGVTAGATANVTNLGANATVAIEGTLVTGVTAVSEVQTIDVGTTTRTDGNIVVGGITVAVLAADTAAQTATKIQTALSGATLTSPASGGAVTATVTGTVVTVTFPNTAGNVTPITVANGTSTITGTMAVGETTPGVVGVTAAGGGTLAVAQKVDGAADTLNLKLNVNYTENNDATATVTAVTHTVNASLIETVNVTSTGKASTAFLGATGHKADGVANTLSLTDNAIVTLNVTGDQALSFTSASTMTKLATIDASANTGGLTFSGAAADMSTDTASVAMTIKGSATAANDLTGTGRNDTIVGGAKADTIKGGAGADTLTGAAGNDTYVMNSAEGVGSDSTLVKMDIITDFVANTFGNGTNGAAGTGAGTDATKLTGDVLKFDVAAAGVADGAVVGVFSSAADAQTFLQNLGADTAAAVDNAFGAALDSSSGKLYVDLDSNGTVDSVVQLTGVTTITAAAFVLA